MTLTAVATYSGGRHHSSVIHAKKVISNDLTRIPELKSKYSILENLLLNQIKAFEYDGD